MSCNGCRVLRRGCSDHCILRPCLEWIQNPQAQSNATLFVSKFFGRSDLMSFISAVPENKRPALFQSLLFEACGRTVNPVNGAVGLLSTGNWHICQAAVETVLAGGVLQPIPAEQAAWRGGGDFNSKGLMMQSSDVCMHGSRGFLGEASSRWPWVVGSGGNCMENTASFDSGISEVSPEMGVVGSKEPKLLNLFA